MLSLPDLRLGDRILRLPLTPPGSVDVANAWLTAEAGERLFRWRSVLRDEPALALWCALQARFADDARPPSFDSLVEWCDRHLLERCAKLGSSLSKAMDDGSPLTSGDVASRRNGCELAIRTAKLAVAGEARGLAGSDWVAEWLGAGPDWLTLAGMGAEAAATSGDVTAVPRWLQLRATRSADSLPALPGDCESAVRSRWESNGPVINLALLAASLSAANRLANEFHRSVEAEKLAALREFAYGASHEINNPLANIATRAQTLLREERDVERRRSLSVMASQAMRAHTMIADVMLFAKPPALRPVPIRLTQLLDRVVAELGELSRVQGTLITRVGGDGDDQVLADADQLAVAVRAIAENALEALGSGGRVELTFERAGGVRSAAVAGGGYRILVRDTGPGIPAAVRRHLFDPYYSGREAGRGLGVGLCKAWRIVTDHGGRIEVANQDDGGTVFALEMPEFPLSDEKAK